jgi:S-formylglutathione hydrolase
MGGHGALTIALKNPDKYRSVSAYAPISAPTQVPWGHKAFTGYLGADHSGWNQYDACALLAEGRRFRDTLFVDQGTSDKFLREQLKPELLEEACKAAGQPLELRMHTGYDHGYFFIQTFIADHMAWHREAPGQRLIRTGPKRIFGASAARRAPRRTTGTGPWP